MSSRLGSSYPFSYSANTRAGRATAALGNLTLMLRTVWPKRQLNWQCRAGAPSQTVFSHAYTLNPSRYPL